MDLTKFSGVSRQATRCCFAGNQDERVVQNDWVARRSGVESTDLDP